MSELLYQLKFRKTIPEQNHKYKYYTPQINQYGILGILATSALTYPLERLKTHLQLQIYPVIYSETGEYLQSETFQTYLIQEQKINKNLSYFYRGFSAKLLKLFTKEFTFYTLCGYINSKIRKHDPSENPIRYSIRNLFAIGISTLLIETIAYPLETAKTRMMCDLDRSSLSKNSTILKALMSTDNENKFYQGFSISIIGSFLYRGIQYGVYDLLVNMGLSQWYLQVPLSISLTLFAQCTTYPIDTIRRYLMVTGTQFQVEYGKPTDIIRRMQLAESGQLLYGIEYQIGKSIVSGLFMFTYKGLEQGFFKQPDIEGGYQI